MLNEGVKNILSGHHLYKNQKFDLDIWLYDLNIIKEHLVSRGIHHTKFGNFQRKGSKDIERTSHGLQTDRKMQNNLPPFFKRRYKNSVRDMFCSNVWRHSQFKKKSPKIPHCANFHAICFGTHGPLVHDFRFESMQRYSQKLQKVNFLHIYISTFLWNDLSFCVIRAVRLFEIFINANGKCLCKFHALQSACL